MIVKLDHLEKRYQGFHLDCSLELGEGCITGLIGANGSGKSTTFKSILGLIRPDGGSVRVFGKDAAELSVKDKEDIGVVLADSSFSGWLTIPQIVSVLGSMYENFHREEFERGCADFGLPADKKLKEFSTGMKAKLKVLIALSHDARLLILDEPTAGMDVAARDEILGLLREYMEKEGRGILISSHISSDLEGLCDDLYMIDQGRIVLHEDTDVLLAKYGLIKMDEADYLALDKRYVISARREPYGYACLTNERDFYAENYPGLAIEQGSVDDVLLMTIKGERV